MSADKVADFRKRLTQLRQEQNRTPKSDHHRRGAITGEINWINNQLRILEKGAFSYVESKRTI